MDVVYITDESYVMPTSVSIVSLCTNVNQSKNINVYIICHGLSETSKNKFKKILFSNLNLKLIDVQEKSLAEIGKNGFLIAGFHVSPSALLKFYLPKIFGTLDKILYLDSDVIINKDISELWEINIADYYSAVVERPYFPTINFDKLGIADEYYFNTGVMLMNLKLMRDVGLTEMLIEYRKNGFNTLMDQDAFNSVMHGKIVKLDYKYNLGMMWFMRKQFDVINRDLFSGAYASEQQCLDEQSIIHLSGGYKPWKYNVPYFTDLFMKYYKKSAYKKEDLNITSLLDLVNMQKDALERYRNLLNLIEIGVIGWRLPYWKLPANSTVVIYGAGECGKSIKKQIEITGYCRIALWVDKNYREIEEAESPNKIKSIHYDYVLIAIAREDIIKEVEEYLSKEGVLRDKILKLI